MYLENATDEEIIELVRNSLDDLYYLDQFLFERNNFRGVCERSLVFRLAYYLQKNVTDFHVDCDFNSSFVGIEGPDGIIVQGEEQSGKPIRNVDGSTTNRFVDIIIHSRNHVTDYNFVAIEVKKWNNQRKAGVEKDINNLKSLTKDYRYKLGFFIVLKGHVKIFRGGINIGSIIPKWRHS